MERKWKERYPQKFRCRAVERVNACDNIVRCARELGVSRSLLYKWRHRLEVLNGQTQSEATIRNSRESTLRREIDRFKRLVANKTAEVDFFKAALQKVEARRQSSGISGEQASTMPSGTSLQGSLSVERMCLLAQVSRAGFYRYLQARAPIEESMTLRSAIQEIALEHRRRYGYRRITAELRQRGMNVNHKRVVRANNYRDMEHLAASIEQFIELYYNRCRLHSAIGYRSPEQFEEQAALRDGGDQHMDMAPGQLMRDSVPIILSQRRVHPAQLLVQDQEAVAKLYQNPSDWQPWG